MTAKAYSSFADKCVREIKILQDKFQLDYNLSWYENWFYNHATGLLTFSTRDKELNFKYFEVGSFSEKSNTWKWAWGNEDIPDQIKAPTEIIKSFGENENFPKLINGLFESNETEAWEFTAIATKLAHGIGIYRPVNDIQLKIFLVVTEFIDNETAKNIKDRYVKCSNHEYRRRAFVCQHLNHSEKVGFEEAFETFEDMELVDDDDLQAWCDECEKVRQNEGEWNDKSEAFAKIKIVCERCYFEMKELNLGRR